MENQDINDSVKWSEFCDRLTRMTASGELTWDNWADRIRRPDARSGLYVAKFQSWRILIFKYTYKYFLDAEHFEWEEDVAMELIDDSGNNEWTFPKVPARHGLIDQIQYRQSAVKSLLDAVLSAKTP
jgi:hypothetical protein